MEGRCGSCLSPNLPALQALTRGIVSPRLQAAALARQCSAAAATPHNPARSSASGQPDEKERQAAEILSASLASTSDPDVTQALLALGASSPASHTGVGSVNAMLLTQGEVLQSERSLAADVPEHSPQLSQQQQGAEEGHCEQQAASEPAHQQHLSPDQAQPQPQREQQQQQPPQGTAQSQQSPRERLSARTSLATQVLQSMQEEAAALQALASQQARLHQKAALLLELVQQAQRVLTVVPAVTAQPSGEAGLGQLGQPAQAGAALRSLGAASKPPRRNSSRPLLSTAALAQRLLTPTPTHKAHRGRSPVASQQQPQQQQQRSQCSAGGRGASGEQQSWLGGRLEAELQLMADSLEVEQQQQQQQLAEPQAPLPPPPPRPSMHQPQSLRPPPQQLVALPKEQQQHMPSAAQPSAQPLPTPYQQSSGSTADHDGAEIQQGYSQAESQNFNDHPQQQQLHEQQQQQQHKEQHQQQQQQQHHHPDAAEAKELHAGRRPSPAHTRPAPCRQPTQVSLAQLSLKHQLSSSATLDCDAPLGWGQPRLEQQQRQQQEARVGRQGVLQWGPAEQGQLLLPLLLPSGELAVEHLQLQPPLVVKQVAGAERDAGLTPAAAAQPRQGGDTLADLTRITEWLQTLLSTPPTRQLAQPQQTQQRHDSHPPAGPPAGPVHGPVSMVEELAVPRGVKRQREEVADTWQSRAQGKRAMWR